MKTSYYTWSIFTAALCCIKGICAQQTLFEYDGLNISNSVQKLEAGGKKDKYLMQVRIISTEKDLYYPASMTLNSRTKKLQVSNKTLGFAKVQNATGLFNSKGIDGEISPYRSEDGSVLYVFKQGKIYTEEDKFKVLTGNEPIITYNESKTVHPLEYYNLMVDGSMVAGNWSSTCSDGTITINYSDTGKTDYITLNATNKIIKWNRRNAYSFEKSDRTATLSYNKSDKSLIYFNTDGIRCALQRQED